MELQLLHLPPAIVEYPSAFWDLWEHMPPEITEDGLYLAAESGAPPNNDAMVMSVPFSRTGRLLLPLLLLPHFEQKEYTMRGSGDATRSTRWSTIQ